MLWVLLVLHWALVVAVACVIVIKYRKTRDSGFLLLGVALLLWPLLAAGLGLGEEVMLHRVVAGEPVGIFPFSLVEAGQMTAGALAASFIYLDRIIASALALAAVASLYTNKAKDSDAGAV